MFHLEPDNYYSMFDLNFYRHQERNTSIDNDK